MHSWNDSTNNPIDIWSSVQQIAQFANSYEIHNQSVLLINAGINMSDKQNHKIAYKERR